MARSHNKDIDEGRANQSALEGWQRAAAIVQSAVDAIIVVDEEGQILLFNEAAKTMFGCPEQEALRRRIEAFVAPRFRAELAACFERARNAADGHRPTASTLRGVRTDGHEFWCEVWIARHDLAGHPEFSVTIRDVGERAQGERAVGEDQEQFRLIANTAPVMIWMSDVDKQVTYVNQRWLDFTGWPVNVAPGHRWIELIHPDDVDRCGDAYTKAFDQRQPFDVEHRLHRSDGEYRWIVTSGVPRYDKGGSFAGYAGIAVDVTERKLAEETLSTLNQRLIEAHEEERTRLARDLHDDIGQQLIVVLLRLEVVKQRVDVYVPELGVEIGRAIEMLTTLSGDVQSLSHSLHPPQLSHVGLEAAVRAVCAEISERTTVEVRFQPESSVAGLPEDVSVCLYRVLQEALQNAMKHSRSRHVDVRLGGDANHVELIVRDAGIGFDANTVPQGCGLGLVGMKERLKMVGGALMIDARPGVGTTIHAFVPVKPRQQMRN